MDGHHTRQQAHDDGPRRGARTATPTKVYRRVVSETADEKEPDAEPKRPFKSSLLQSLADEQEKENARDDAGRGRAGASPAKRGGRGGGGRGGGGAEQRRSRSPRKTDAASGRQVTLTTTANRSRTNSIESNTSTSSKNRWARKNNGGNRDGGASASAQDVRYGGNGGRGSSLRRTESDVSYRRVEISHGNRSGARHRSDSIESDASVQSVHSVHSVQSTRSTSSRYESRSSRYGGDYNSRRQSDRLSLPAGLKEDRQPLRRVERSTSDHSTGAPSGYRGRDRDEHGAHGHRSQDDRPPPPPTRRAERSPTDHSENSSQSPVQPARSSSLATSSLAKAAAPAIATKPLATSSQDVRFAGSAERPKFTSSLVSSLAGNSKPAETTKPVFKSSLASSTTNTPAADTQKSADDEERRRQAAERLKERLQSRGSSFGSSLRSSIQDSAPTHQRTEKEIGKTRVDSPPREPRQSSILSRVGDRPVPTQSDKEARTREFFAKLEREDSKREQTRRQENGFKSSLKDSIAPRNETPPKPTLRDALAARAEPAFKSSLRSSLAARRESPSGPILNKKLYTIADLRALKPSSPGKCPPDLRDMRIVEVIEVAPPRKVNGGSSGSGRRVEVSSRRGSSKRGGQGRGASSGGKPPPKGDRHRPGAGGGRRGGPPPPPLYDGPIEPLTISENRWQPKKGEKSEFEATLSHVKSVLNKLTREKFAKLTDELCSTKIDSMELLGSIIAAIMNKAIEEPNFADVYADLCKQFHLRTSSKTWSFLRPARRLGAKETFAWTAVRKDDTDGFVGPFPSENECVEAATKADSDSSENSSSQDVWKAKFFVTTRHLVAIVEATKGSFYYKRKSLDTLADTEPVLGEYESTDAALQAAVKETSFKRLLVTRCQTEFDRFNKTEQTTEGEMDERQKELAALRLKRLMLGNIRFIGELFKVDLLNQRVVQTCLFYLLGLELVEGASEDQLAGQEVRFPDEEDVEALCKLLATVGKKYDQPKTQSIMRIVIFRLVELSEEKKLPSRARFLLKDVLEMRDHLWEPRRKEMQQKTLEEVRREAMKLQSQGKNAQHDDLKQRRLKSQISSVQLAKQSSNLLVRKDTSQEAHHNESHAEPAAEQSQRSTSLEEDPAKVQTRIKSIIQEYGSIHDVQEAAACVRELPRQSLVDFAEEIVNRALEGKDQERADVVELLVKLYEGGAIDAMSIQLAIVNVMEFLEDIKIDIPHVHQYSALVFGRLIAAGCFGLSWMMSDALQHVVDNGLASLVFAETLPVIESDSDERTVIRMVADEEVTPASVLPRSARRDEAAVAKFVKEHDLGVYFGTERPHDEDDEDEEEEELDPEIESKMRNTLEEYLSVKDLDEVVLCVNELGGAGLWKHFLRVAITTSLDAKQAMRLDVAALFMRLVGERGDDVDVEDLEWAFETALIDYEDVRVDVPRLAHNFAELWTSLFERGECLTLSWLHDVVTHLLASGDAADLLNALLSRYETEVGREQLLEWWQKQKPSEGDWLMAFSGVDGVKSVHARLAAWPEVLGSP